MAQELAKELIETMKRRSVTLATCESLTGGAIGAALTEVPGASAVYRGGLVTYARDLKAELAGVDEELIRTEGVVNELTAIQMALGNGEPIVVIALPSINVVHMRRENPCHSSTAEQNDTLIYRANSKHFSR